MCKTARELAFIQTLDLLELFLELQRNLAEDMRSGHIQLSSAKYSLGAGRISSLQLPAQMQATLRVTVSGDSFEASSIIPSSTCTSQPLLNGASQNSCHGVSSITKNAYSNNISSSIDQVPCSRRNADNQGAVSGLHSATARSSVLQELAAKYNCLDENDSVSTGNKEGQVDTPNTCSPLLWFGALLPPSLLEAQLSFKKCVATALQIASVKQQLLRQLGEYQRLCSESQNVAELSLASSAVQ